MKTALRSRIASLTGMSRRVDWPLLLFLLGFCVDSVVVKPVVTVLALVALRRGLPGPAWRATPWFYLALPAMEIIRYAVFIRDFSAGHTLSFLIGCSYWLMAWIAFVIVRSRVRMQAPPVVISTMELWFWLNAAFSLLQLGQTMVHAGSLNPFGVDDPMYGNSTGDYLKGLFLAPCYLNMFVNSFFAVWALFRQRWGIALTACLICCLTSTNFANIVFLPVLLSLSAVLRTRAARLTIIGCVGLFVAFYIFVGSGNLSYLRQSVSNTSGVEIQSGAGAEAGLEVPASAPEDEQSRHAAAYQRLASPNGKMLSWKQTLDYLGSGAPQLIFGAGVGNFSSLLALQMAHIHGRKHSRFYERLPVYVHPAYRDRHYQIMRDVYDLPEGYHSARHMPHSFPNQLLGEYGLVGLALFVLGYAAWMFRRVTVRGPMLFIALLTAGYLWFDYLFEYLSVMVFFELFFLQQFYVNQKTHPDA